MNVREIQISGAVVYWSAGPTRRELLEARLAQIGLADDTPNGRTDASALRAALEQWTVETQAKGHGIDYQVQPHKVQSRHGFELVKVERGSEFNTYNRMFGANVEYGAVRVDDSGWGNESLLQTLFRHHKGLLTGAAIGQMLVAILAKLGGTALRPSGGVYWIPQASVERFSTIAAFVEECGEQEGNKVYMIRTAMDEQTVRAVRDAITAEVTAESQRIAKELTENQFGEDALNRRLLLAAALHARVSQYEGILGEALTTLHEVVRVAEQAAASAQAVKESNEVFDGLFAA